MLNFSLQRGSGEYSIDWKSSPCQRDLNKKLPCLSNAGGAGSIPGSGRSPGEENGNPLQYFCLKNSRDRGIWQAIVDRITKSDTTEATKHRHKISEDLESI